MKILLTGGTGYIGSHTAVELIQLGHEVVILDNLANSKITVLDRIEQLTDVKPRFYEADIRDREKLLEIFKAENFDAVIHFAGLKAVGESVEKPLEYYETNVGGSINLFEVMLETGVKKIIFSSSATVYGTAGEAPYTEDMPTGQGITNPYGQTKYMIEQILKDTAIAHPDFEVTLLRYFNPVGAHPSGLLGEDPNGRPNNLMPIIMRVAQGKISDLEVYGNDYDTEDGTCLRDYIHVVDLAKGHVAALDHQKPGVNIYNLGTGVGTSVLDMVLAFEAASSEPLRYRVVGRRAGDLAKVYSNPAKAERELGWKAELTIDDAMRDTINYLRHEKND